VLAEESGKGRSVGIGEDRDSPRAGQRDPRDPGEAVRRGAGRQAPRKRDGRDVAAFELGPDDRLESIPGCRVDLLAALVDFRHHAA
jgi:hypothetical protein